MKRIDQRSVMKSGGVLTSRCLGAGETNLLWEALEPLIERSLEPSLREISAQEVQKALAKGDMMALIAERDREIEMVCVVEIAAYPAYRALHIVALAGKNLKDSMQFLSALGKLALAYDCVEIRGWVRKPQLRLYQRLKLPFSAEYTMIRHNLRGKLQ